MKPKHKFNNGVGATLCIKCDNIISLGYKNYLLCDKCKLETDDEAIKRREKAFYDLYNLIYTMKDKDESMQILIALEKYILEIS